MAVRGAFGARARSVSLLIIAVVSGTISVPPGRASADATVIVDWGGDYVSTDTAMARYITVEYPVDLDGGTNDARAYLPYSDTEPLNPNPTGGNAYGTTYAAGTSYRFYGGILFQHYDAPFASKWGEVWERGAQDRIYQSADAPSDGWALLYWKKADFLHGADGAAVHFDAASSLEVLNYAGADGVVANNFGQIRFAVRDGSQFYLSEATGDKATSAQLRLVDPTGVRWAPYAPAAPYGLRFDAASAVFATHTFTNITAVGFYHASEQTTDPGRRAGLNLERFRVSASLDQPPLAPSYHVALPLCIR